MEIEKNVASVNISGNQSMLRLKEKISYGFGDLASNLMWGLVGSFLLYFYTDVALVPVAATGTLFLICRVLDAFIDPVIGGFIDRTNTKFGRTKPYILFGIIPFAVVLILTFTSFDISDTGKIVYAYITYIIAGLLYSVVNIPYGALLPLMTRDSNEKATLSSFRMGGMAIGNILVTAATMPLVGFLGDGNERRGFLLTTILYSILGIICFGIIVKNCQERYLDNHTQSTEKVSVSTTYKNAFKNGPWLSTIIFALIMFVKIGAQVAITIYFCNIVLGNPALISVLLPLLYVSMIVSSVITPAFIKKFKHRKGNIIALSIYIVGFCLLPFIVSNMTFFIVVYFIANIFGGIGTGAVFGMTADSVDYNEWKFGNRAEGTLYAGYSFATKVGMAIGGALVGYVLAFAGYNANHVTNSAANAINFLYYFVPIFCSLLQIIALSFYKLDKIHPQIVSELNQRN